MNDTENWRSWARVLEQTRRFSDQWPQGQWPTNSDLTFLITDGFHSSSVRHWQMAPGFEDVIQDASRSINDVSALIDLKVCGFSYLRYGQHYFSYHTRQSLTTIAHRFSDYLRVAKQDVVCISYSLGCAITLLGVRRFLLDKTQKRRVRAIILVAPATSPSVYLLRSYQEWARQNRRDEKVIRSIPTALTSLLRPQSRLRQEIAGCFDYILDKDIPIRVMHSSRDSFTPFAEPLLTANSRRLYRFVSNFTFI